MNPRHNSCCTEIYCFYDLRELTQSVRPASVGCVRQDTVVTCMHIYVKYYYKTSMKIFFFNRPSTFFWKYYSLLVDILICLYWSCSLFNHKRIKSFKCFRIKMYGKIDLLNLVFYVDFDLLTYCSISISIQIDCTMRKLIF